MDIEQLDAFLLRRLADDRRGEIEDRYFDEDELFARLLERQDDLIDAYAAGELPEAEAARLRELAERDDRLAARIAFSRALQLHLLPAAAAPVVSLEERRKAMTPRYVMAAAFVLVLAGSIWFASTRGRADLPGQEMAKREVVTSPAPPVTIVPAPAPPQIAKSKKKPIPGEAVVAPVNEIATFVLSIAATRSEQRIPVLQTADRKVRFELRLDPAEEYERIEIEISGPGGGTVFGPVQRSVLTSGSTRSIDFEVPTERLGTGTYELEARGLADGDSEQIGFVQFAVRR